MNRAMLISAVSLCVAAGSFALPVLAENNGHTQLRIATDPPGARIYVNNKLRNTSPVTLTDLHPGIHLITAQLPGYHEVRATVALDPEQRLPLDLTLRPITGLILLHADPTHVNITIEGVHRGETPLLLTDMPIGRYRVKASRAGYLPMERDLIVENRIPQKINFELRPDAARVRFDSTPRGARVFIDGVLSDTTPCDIENVPSGNREIEIRLEGHRVFRREFELTAGEERSIRAELEPLPGALQITSIPDGARVYVDNVPRGETPAEIKYLVPGEYAVRVESRGHAPETAELTVRKDTVTAHEFRLRRDSGKIVLTTEPARVRVLLDGIEKGFTEAAETDAYSKPFDIDYVPQGKRNLQLSREGYYPAEAELEIEPGRTLTHHAELSRRFIPDTRVRVGEGPGGVITGVLQQQYPSGDIEIETRPGIFRTIESHRIISVESISDDEDAE